VWHRDRDLDGADLVILPGGFSYGDYLRAGAIARFSPAMQAVAEHARTGGAVLGVCNGFQILCEAGLLPGALTRNAGLRFLSRPVRVRVERTDTPFTALYTTGEVLDVPIAHGDGRYVADSQAAAEPRQMPSCLRYVTESNGSTSRYCRCVQRRPAWWGSCRIRSAATRRFLAVKTAPASSSLRS
jgi:phosphoribosylformylglycinamidine synthase